MKKLTAFVLAMAMVLCLAACGNNAGTAEGGDSDKLRIAFIPQLIGIPYFTAMEEGGLAGC